MSPPMNKLTGRTVWVVEVGCYESRYVGGVYSSAEAAISAWPARELPEDFKATSSYSGRRGGWQVDDSGVWSNGLDWDEAARITPYVIDE